MDPSTPRPHCRPRPRRRPRVGREHRQLAARAGAQQVLRADPQVGGVGDHPGDVLMTHGHLVGGADQKQLLRAYPQVDRAVVGPGPAGGHREARAVRRHHDVAAAGTAGLAGQQVGPAQEVRDERGGGKLVDVGGCAELLDPAGVHHRDRVRHGHGLLLVVRDVHEGDADLGLDALQLDLHLSAQRQVEGTQRLVEQQHLRPVDQRTDQRDPLLLTAGELGRAAAAVAVEPHQRQHPVDLGVDRADAASAQPERHVLEDGRGAGRARSSGRRC